MAALLEPYLPLYLKHRPQTLGQLVGQRTVVKTLTNAIDNDRIAHAYLFTGPRGTGKTSSARILAKSLNCENGPTATPCMKCTMCEEIKKGISPAVMEIDAASNNSVDDARVLIERAPLVAQGGRFKLYIIDECHMLTKEAFNALLKTIEEPPPKVIFILATTEEHKVPPTIISRCQRLMFRLANHEELCEHLRKIADIEKIAIEDDALELIARRSGGGLRDALGLLDQASLLATPEKPVGIKDLLVLLGAIEEDVLISISEGIADRDAERVLTSTHELLAQGREPSLVALELAKHFLNLAKGMHLANTKGAASQSEQVETSLAQQLITGSQNYIQRVIELSNSFQGAELTQIVMELDRLEQTLRRSTQPSLALEIGLLSLCHRHDILLFKELAKKVEYLEGAITGGAMPMLDPSHSHGAGHASSHGATHPQPHAPVHSQGPSPVRNPLPPAPAALAATAIPPPAATPTPPPVLAAATPPPPLPAATAAPTPTPAVTAASSPVAAVSPTPALLPETNTAADHAAALQTDAAPAPTRTPAPAAESPSSDNGHDDLAKPARQLQDTSEYEVNEDGDVEPVSSGLDPDAEDTEPGSSASPAATASTAPHLSSPIETAARAGSADEAVDLSRSEDLDEFWSNLMSDLQSRHLPSYSLISQFGFPLSVRQDELVIGVLKENFQKMIEGKAEQIKTSAKIVCGRELFIKVRVSEKESAPAKATNSGGKPQSDGPTGANRGQRQEKSSLPSASSKDASGDEEPGEPALATQTSALRSTVTTEERRPASSAYGAQNEGSSSISISAFLPAESDAEQPATATGQNPADNHLMIKEAYKLFEGPGSRRVG